MNTKVIFADYPDIPSCLEPNSLCMHSCPDIGYYQEAQCKEVAFSTLYFATYRHYTKRSAECYPAEWLNEEVVVCRRENVCVLLGPEARQKRRRKMLTRQEIITRLKYLRQDAEGWGEDSLLKLQISFAGMMYDICQGLGLSKEEYTRILGTETLKEIIEESNRVYWVNPELASKLAQEGGTKC